MVHVGLVMLQVTFLVIALASSPSITAGAHAKVAAATQTFKVTALGQNIDIIFADSPNCCTVAF
jgi:hypothetical protein